LITLGNPLEATGELLDLAFGRGYRIVAIEGTVPAGVTDYVGIDDNEGMRLALRHLVDLGHKNITLIVNEPFRLDQVIQRQAAFEAISRSLGINGVVVSSKTEYWENPHDAAYRVMPEVWSGSPRPTAILTVSDAGAWAVLKWLSENGVKIPQDVSVMGFDDDWLSKCTHPALTTLGRDCALIAREALGLLHRPATKKSMVLIKPYVIERESVGQAQPGA
jgi:DNA-binding LacI/PurR family transcriptional regulator